MAAGKVCGMVARAQGVRWRGVRTDAHTCPTSRRAAWWWAQGVRGLALWRWQELRHVPNLKACVMVARAQGVRGP